MNWNQLKKELQQYENLLTCENAEFRKAIITKKKILIGDELDCTPDVLFIDSGIITSESTMPIEVVIPDRYKYISFEQFMQGTTSNLVVSESSGKIIIAADDVEDLRVILKFELTQFGTTRKELK